MFSAIWRVANDALQSDNMADYWADCPAVLSGQAFNVIYQSFLVPVTRGVYPPQQPWRNPSPSTPSSPVPSFFFPSPSLPFLELQMLIGEFWGILDIKINICMSQVFWLKVVSFEFQVNVHAALWIDEVLHVIIWQKYPLSVGLSQHASAIALWSWPTGRCITLYRILSNFFLPP